MMTAGLLASSSNPLDHVVQHELFCFHVGSVPVVFSDHMLMLLVAAVSMLIIFPLIARQRSLVPTGLRNYFETVCVFMREDVARPVLGDQTDRFIGYIWTTFFFILACNLLGMFPSAAILELLSLGRLRHLGGTATANVWVTGALAFVAFMMIHVTGVRSQGVKSYVRNFIPRVPWPLVPMMYILEIISSLVKPFALAVRLFANMLAGHTILAAMLGLAMMARALPWFGSASISVVTVVACAVLSILEIFVAFLQAYIFTYLTTIFIGAAIEPQH